MDPESTEPAPVSRTSVFSAFGLDAPDDEWLVRLRQATRVPQLERIGDYQLLEEFSRGAQGVVYRARRTGETKTVAVKRLLAGRLATGSARARFSRELEMAAALKHPHIVGTLEVRSWGNDPILVMEWIDGTPVDRWADRSRQPQVRVILEVFLDVCAAVHHAHQRGVIHRDLKPSNILVDALNHPHLLDFGLAKIIAVDGSGGSTVTGSRDFLGTPAYAAPEQVRGDHAVVDVRTDVYALGVILFRLLTRRLPFEVNAGLAALLVNIQHADAPRPSRLNRALNDELDSIIGKAMAKDMDRRYASVDALAADVRRQMVGDAVEAKRGRRWYDLRKTIQRHRAVATSLVVVLLVASSAAIALWGMYLRQGQLLTQVLRARDAESQAHRSALQQQRVLEKLLSAVAEIGKGADLDVRRAWLDEATQLVQANMLDDPVAEAAAHDAIGRTYQSLALYPEAEDHLRKALQLRRKTLPAGNPDVAASLHHLGKLYQDRNHFAEAEPFLQEALAMRQRFYAEDHPDLAASLNAVGFALQSRREYASAEKMHEQALRMYRQLFGDQHRDVALTLHYLGNLRLNQSQFADAESFFREALDINRALYGEDHRNVADTKVSLGKALFCLGRYTEAEPLFREAIGTNRSLLGNSHDNVAWGLHRLGLLLHAKGEYDEAESALRESLSIYRRCLGDQDHYVALVLNSLGTLCMDRGDLHAAKTMFEEAIAIQESLAPSDGAFHAWKQNRIAEWLERSGNYDGAEPLLRQVIERQDEVELTYAVRCMNSLARLLMATNQSEEAEEILTEALQTRRRLLGPTHPDVGQSLVNLAAVVQTQGRLDEASELVQQGIDIQRATLGNDHPDLARSLLEWADIADALGETHAAANGRQEAEDICKTRECHSP